MRWVRQGSCNTGPKAPASCQIRPRSPWSSHLMRCVGLYRMLTDCVAGRKEPNHRVRWGSPGVALCTGRSDEPRSDSDSDGQIEAWTPPWSRNQWLHLTAGGTGPRGVLGCPSPRGWQRKGLRGDLMCQATVMRLEPAAGSHCCLRHLCRPDPDYTPGPCRLPRESSQESTMAWTGVQSPWVGGRSFHGHLEPLRC